ncbi:MAG: TIGR03960 family B12-binding radical SAM protein [Nitrospiraceae bacterium]|nr:TIGR03960 family B12-binding radical SAM protein [Nitrospiraceae bacterium]
MNYSLFQKPSRYINNEINSIHKHGEVNVALAFPDVYEIGMSHLGLKILYKIINELPYASAQRAFHPWLDMENEMKNKGILLSSLETQTLLKNFDIVGFSLQYELSYTSVLNMLSLSGIPLKTSERIDGDWPLIIAGGPCTVNPAPMSAFIDAFLIGDGEEAVVEILDAYRKWKKQGDGKKKTILKLLSEIQGIYVPSVHNSLSSEYLVKRRFIESLDSAPYPDSPIVPYMGIVHDRVNIEVSRGCTMGCRFCQAGIIYRPLRERSPENILRIAENSLKNTGYDELSFTSLSAGDYSSLIPLLRGVNQCFHGRNISLSLPSLRVGAVNKEVLKEIKTVRKTGFTIAPEAGTARLRSVINKNFSEEDYDRSLKLLFKEGWQNIKLYFMIGLPTETDEDIAAIPEMAMKALKTAKEHTGRFVNINIGISPFVPKPHTPFQWYGQNNISEIKRKMNYLREFFMRKKFKFKSHDMNMSLLEAVFARGDEKLSFLIEKAWSLGCRLDGWGESFDFEKWRQAMDETGIDASAYAERTFEKEERLPWDFIDTGIKKQILYKEYENALKESITPDCMISCYACGLNCKKIKQKDNEMETSDFIKTPPVDANAPTQYLRIEFSKTGVLRYLSHFEITTALLRAMRRAGIYLEYSKGFHPFPKMSFGPALSVGISGMREYFDMEISSASGIDYTISRINDFLPEGLKIKNAILITAKEQSLSSFISRYEYEIKCSDSSVVNNKSLSGVENIEIVDNNTVRIILADKEDKKVKASEIFSELFSVPSRELDITRLAMYGKNASDNSWVTPVERCLTCPAKS